jgi:SAM-dependent methyltransferase
MKREFQIEFLKQAGLRPSHRLLDLGCGTLRGGVPIIGFLDPGNYFGIEARGEVLDKGRKELRESRLEEKVPTLIVAGDLARVSLPVKFDFIWAFSVLIHMRDDVLDGCLRLAAAHLSTEGRLYANVDASQRPDGHWEGFPMVFRSLKFYEAAAARWGLRIEDLGPLSSWGHASGVESHDEQRMLKLWREGS